MRKHAARLIVILAIISLLLPPLPAQAQTPSQVFPETGFAVADTTSIRFLSEFRRLGGVDGLGYPISQPFVAEGFAYQAFQRAVLQWRPEVNQAYFANTMDWLSDTGNDPYLASLGIPGPLPDAGGAWEQVVAERESWLTELSIAAAYRQGGGYNRFGLPTSRPQQAGPFIVQRFQRYAFQLWTEAVPGMPARGSVVGVLAGDLVRQAGLVPEAAAAPGAPTDGLACTSNPQSAVKSREVDVVRYSQARLPSGQPGLSVVLRNNCPEPTEIGLRVRALANPNALPHALGREVRAEFGPGEEKTFLYSFANPNGSYPRINATDVFVFRWNWQQVGSDEMVCLDVGVERCLPTDPWLRSTVEELQNLPAGATLLRTAAQFGARVRRGDLAEDVLGLYQRFGRTVTVGHVVTPYSEFEQGTVLAHELQHVADHAAGRIVNTTESCLATEERAFRTGAETWFNFWRGTLPTPTNSLQSQFNRITSLARNNPAQLDRAILSLYEDSCS